MKRQLQSFAICLLGIAFHSNSWVVTAHSSPRKSSVNLWKQMASSTCSFLCIIFDPTAKQSVLFKHSSNFFKAERGESIKQSLPRFLFSYWMTSNISTGQTPAEMFLNRWLRTRLDGRRIRSPDTIRLVKEENSPLVKKFWCKTSVLSRSGTVTEQTSPVSHKVLVKEQLWKRHVDQIHQRHLNQKLV